MSVILLRHAWAGHRGEWSEDDLLRPLDERGHRQARELPRLELYGLEVGRIVSSPYVRCVETVTPLDINPYGLRDNLHPADVKGGGR